MRSKAPEQVLRMLQGSKKAIDPAFTRINERRELASSIIETSYSIGIEARLRQIKADGSRQGKVVVVTNWESPMPYASNETLPPSVRHHLPLRAQDLYREAFNDAWASHARDERREEISHRTAWAAVKRHFHKGAGGQWEPNIH